MFCTDSRTLLDVSMRARHTGRHQGALMNLTVSLALYGHLNERAIGVKGLVSTKPPLHQPLNMEVSMRVLSGQDDIGGAL